MQQKERTAWGLVLASVVGSLAIQPASAAKIPGRTESYQHNALFTPGEAQLAQEARGRVFIYDGLSDKEVELALDQHSDRMQSMMFVRVRKTDSRGKALKDPATGEAMVADDGCD